MKVIRGEIKKNLQGRKEAISGGEEARIQIYGLQHKEEISIQPEQKGEKKNEKKMKIVYGLSGTSPNVPTSES